MNLSQFTRGAGRPSEYNDRKEELAQLLSLGLSSEKIGERMGKSGKTIRRWIRKYYTEVGKVIDEEKPELARKFFTDSLTQFSIMERKLMKRFLEEDRDAKHLAGLANSILRLKEKEADFLSRLNVINPSVTENRVTGGISFDDVKDLVEEYAAERGSKPVPEEEWEADSP